MKNPWKKIPQPPTPPVVISLGNMAPNLKDDKAFWSDCVENMLDYEVRDSKRAILIADELLEARRERFPEL